MDIETEILGDLGCGNGVIDDTYTYALEKSFDHQQVIGMMKSLCGDQYVEILEEKTTSIYTLTDEGKNVASDGSPEFLVYSACPVDGINMSDLQNIVGSSMCKLVLGHA